MPGRWVTSPLALATYHPCRPPQHRPDLAVSTDPSHAPDALATALRQVLAPVARLALARGVTYATLDELLKQALVAVADASNSALPPHRRVSRITTATGIHRREVTRLVTELREGSAEQPPPARSHASELFHHWRTDAEFCDRKGSPAELPRIGATPSFEALAHGITRDVHPRSLLDELLRLGLAAHDRERDTVRLIREAFVPQGDEPRAVAVLGRNVGAHLEAAVDNVLLDNRQHFEQALYADGLSEASMAEFRTLVRDQWQALLTAMVPRLEALVAQDAQASQFVAEAGAAAPAPLQHVRIGLYTHAQPVPAQPDGRTGDAPHNPSTKT